jgi:hypothetical protein
MDPSIYIAVTDTNEKKYNNQIKNHNTSTMKELSKSERDYLLDVKYYTLLFILAVNPYLEQDTITT